MFVDHIHYTYAFEACVFDSVSVEHFYICLMLWGFGYTFLINFQSVEYKAVVLKPHFINFKD